MGLDILVCGGGMYVAGRGADGYDGTIMPALLEGRRQGLIGRIAIATTRPATAEAAAAATARLAQAMGVDGTVEVWPKDGPSAQAFLDAAASFRPHAAAVSVPDHLHAAVAAPLAEKGIHCLVVKPLAGTLSDARAMAEAAEAGGALGCVEFHKRLDDANLLLKSAIGDGRIGQPLYAVVEYSQRKTVPRDSFKSWAESSSIFQYLGVHYVDLLLWATGFTPISASAWGQKDYLSGLGIDTWDAMQVVVEWARPDGGRFVSTHITNWIDPDQSSAMSDQAINVVGTKGRFQSDQKHRGVQVVTDGQGTADINPYFSVSRRDDFGRLEFSGYGIRSVLQFCGDVAAIRAGERIVADFGSIRPTFRQGLISTAVIEAVHASIANGGRPKEIHL